MRVLSVSAMSVPAVLSVFARAQFPGGAVQDGVFDWIEQVRRTIAERGEARIESVARVPYPLDQRAKVLAVSARHVLGLAELLDQILPGSRVQLPAVQGLQRQLARDAARAAVFARIRRAHHRALTAAPGAPPSRARLP